MCGCRAAALSGEQPFEKMVGRQGDDLPAGGPGHALQSTSGDVRDHPIERLPVEVHDPDELAELRHRRVEQRLPDCALIKLGVADQRALPST